MLREFGCKCSAWCSDGLRCPSTRGPVLRLRADGDTLIKIPASLDMWLITVYHRGSYIQLGIFV